MTCSTYMIVVINLILISLNFQIYFCIFRQSRVILKTWTETENIFEKHFDDKINLSVELIQINVTFESYNYSLLICFFLFCVFFIEDIQTSVKFIENEDNSHFVIRQQFLETHWLLQNIKTSCVKLLKKMLPSITLTFRSIFDKNKSKMFCELQASF